MVEDIEYIKSKINETITELTEEEKKKVISYIIEYKKTKAIGQ